MENLIKLIKKKKPTQSKKKMTEDFFFHSSDPSGFCFVFFTLGSVHCSRCVFSAVLVAGSAMQFTLSLYTVQTIHTDR